MNPRGKTKEKQSDSNLPEESVPSFIRKTYEILEESKYADIIRWSDDGTAVVILNPTDFAQKVLPAYFKHNNLTSFIRQLNMYNFHKKRGLNMDNVYCHDLFQRGKKHLLKEIKRKNTESVTPSSLDKTAGKSESSQAKQDLAAVVHENVLLKNYNQNALNQVALLESKIKELSIENQALWNQIYQLKEKENMLKGVIVNFIQQHDLSLSSLPPALQNDLDFTPTITLKTERPDKIPAFSAQTTTKMNFPSSPMFSQITPSLQQDIQKNYKFNPSQTIQHGESDFNLGNITEPKVPRLKFENVRAIEELDPWSSSFENIKPINMGNFGLNINKTEENLNPNLGKRRPGNQHSKEDKESFAKKFKQNPYDINEGNLKPQFQQSIDIQNPQERLNLFSSATIGNNLSNTKDEGTQKESK